MDTYFLIGLSWLAWLVLGYHFGRRKSKKMEDIAYNQGLQRGISRVNEIINDPIRFYSKNLGGNN